MNNAILKYAALALMVVACDNPDEVVQPPHINAFSPAGGYASFANTGLAGTEVIISGSNFSAAPAGNIVTVNGTDAAVVNSTTTEITITIPAGASTGKISVTVNNFTGTSTEDFVVHSQNVWQSVADFGGLPRYGAVSFVIDNFAYVGTIRDPFGHHWCIEGIDSLKKKPTVAT